MSRIARILSTAIAATALTTAVHAQGNDSTTAAPGQQRVTIAFAAKVGARPFACGEVYDGVGLGQTSVKGSDMRFYVHDVELTTADGKAVPLALDQDALWQYKNLAMLDFEDGTSSCSNGNAGLHKDVTGTVPVGTYTGLRFTVGVPFELDHMDPASAPSPLNMTAMFWNWQNGYKFLKAEVTLLKPLPAMASEARPTLTPVSAAPGQTMGQAKDMASAKSMKPRMRSNGFPVHLGSTGCASTTPSKGPAKECVHPNRPVIVFQTFDTTHDTVVFDLAQLLKGVDLSVAPPKDSGPGCMSFPEMALCKDVLPTLGLPFGDAPATTQTVFSREAKP